VIDALGSRARICRFRSRTPPHECLQAVLIASRWLPFDAMCLTRAAVLTDVLRSTGHDARFCIGLYQYPFVAHAWAELDGSVVGDDPELATRLAVVLRVP